MKQNNFVHLHGHSEFSMLDGVGTLDHITTVAKEIGFDTLALTDHGNVSGVLKFAKFCKKKGIKPIVGCEIYCVDDPSFRKGKNGVEKEKRCHTIVLSKNWEGFLSLQSLLTDAYSETGFYYKPRVSWERALQLKSCIITSACVGGMMASPRHRELSEKFSDAYGEDFYFEIQPHVFELQNSVNLEALNGARRLSRKVIATNDFHYARPEDSLAQETLLGTYQKKTISDKERWTITKGLYLRTRAEMEEAFAHPQNTIGRDIVAQALDNTLEVAEKCSFDLPKFDVDLPDVDMSEFGTDDPDIAIAKLCRHGWNRRFNFARDSPEGTKYFVRLQHELGLIKRLKFARYFLIVRDIYKFCDRNGIAYNPGRGSSAGSLVCYLLGITNVDPLHYDLIFERFINPERIDLPDMDLDFDHLRREEVYRYLQSKYHVAHIPTFNGMNAKMVLRDVGRFHEIDLKEVDAVCKELDSETKKQDRIGLRLSACIAAPLQYPKLAAFKTRHSGIIDIALVLEGQVRQTGIHAGGVIISKRPLQERVALEHRNGDISINFDMYDLDQLGLLKLDVLGLKTVTVLNTAKKYIETRVGKERGKTINMSLSDIPLNDPASLREFDRGNTTAVFQFESTGMRKLLREMAPHSLDTLITANAMFRPGPLQFSGTYVANKRNPALIKSTGNKKLDEITRETFGVFIYQEQVMQIAHLVAGYTYPEADMLRKKISKSLGREEVEADREKFVNGCVANGGLSTEIANHIFSQIVEFGRYAFNKAHATTYSVLAFQAMWMRTHFPAEFLASQIAFCNDKNERSLLYNEAKRLGLKLFPADINRSDEYCKHSPTALRVGLNEIDGLGTAIISFILKLRGDKPFASYQDFLMRLKDKRLINVRVRQLLLRSGLFDSLHKQNEIIQFLKLEKNEKPEPELCDSTLQWMG